MRFGGRRPKRTSAACSNSGRFNLRRAMTLRPTASAVCKNGAVANSPSTTTYCASAGQDYRRRAEALAAPQHICYRPDHRVRYRPARTIPFRQYSPSPDDGGSRQSHPGILKGTAQRAAFGRTTAHGRSINCHPYKSTVIESFVALRLRRCSRQSLTRRLGIEPFGEVGQRVITEVPADSQRPARCRTHQRFDRVKAGFPQYITDQQK